MSTISLIPGSVSWLLALLLRPTLLELSERPHDSSTSEDGREFSELLPVLYGPPVVVVAAAAATAERPYSGGTSL